MPIQTIPLLYSLSGVFIIWSQLGCDPQPRRLYFFTLWIALTITYGFYKIRRSYKHQIFVLRVITYIIAITTITWTINGIRTVNELSTFYGVIYKQDVGVELIAMSVILFLIIFTPYEIILTKKPCTFWM